MKYEKRVTIITTIITIRAKIISLVSNSNSNSLKTKYPIKTLANPKIPILFNLEIKCCSHNSCDGNIPFFRYLENNSFNGVADYLDLLKQHLLMLLRKSTQYYQELTHCHLVHNPKLKESIEFRCHLP